MFLRSQTTTPWLRWPMGQLSCTINNLFVRLANEPKAKTIMSNASMFSPSDSGFLDAFLPGPAVPPRRDAKQPKRSRVGDSPDEIDNPLCSSVEDSESIFGSDEESSPVAPTDAQIDELLNAVTLPPSYVANLRRTFGM